MDILLEITLVGVIVTGISAYCFYKAYGLKKRKSDRYKIVSLGIIALIMLVIGLGILSYGILLISDPPKLQPELDDRIPDKIRATSIGIAPIYEQNDEMFIQVSNKGDRAINVSKYDISYGPPDWSPVSYRVIGSRAPNWSVSEDGNQCFTLNMTNGSEMDSDILSKGERAVCSTGIKFPDKNETVQIRVESTNFDYSTSYDCSVDSSDARTC